MTGSAEGADHRFAVAIPTEIKQSSTAFAALAEICQTLPVLFTLMSILLSSFLLAYFAAAGTLAAVRPSAAEITTERTAACSSEPDVFVVGDEFTHLKIPPLN